MHKGILRELQNIAKELKVIGRNTEKEKLTEVGVVEFEGLNFNEHDIEKIAKKLSEKLETEIGNQ